VNEVNENIPCRTYKLSVCHRKGKVSVGVFSDFDLIRDFIEYDDEITGIQESRVWLMDNFQISNPDIVRPKVTKIVCR